MLVTSIKSVIRWIWVGAMMTDIIVGWLNFCGVAGSCVGAVTGFVIGVGSLLWAVAFAFYLAVLAMSKVVEALKDGGDDE